MDDSYKFALELVDQLSGPAKTAKQEMAALTADLQDDVRALDALKAKMGEAAGKTADLKAELAKLVTEMPQAVDQHAKLEKQIKAAETAETRIASAIKSKTAALDKDAVSIRKEVNGQLEMQKAAKKSADEASGLSSTIEALGPYAMAAGAAFLALAAAVGALVIGGAHIALEATTFKNQTTAALQSAVGTREEANAAFQEIRKIGDEVGISDAKAQKYGLALLDAGVARDQLGDTLKSIAMLEKVRGEEAAGKLQELLKKTAAAGAFKLEGESLMGTGISKNDVYDALATKLGKSNAEIDAMMKAGQIKAEDGVEAINKALGKEGLDASGVTSFGDATGKLYELFTRLFENVNTKPLFDVIKGMGDMLGEGTVQGRALRFILTSVFDGFFATAKAVFPYVQFAFNEVIIIALKLYIALKPAIKAIQEFFAGADQGDLEEVIKDVLYTVVAIAGAVVLTVGAIIAFQAAIVAAVIVALEYFGELVDYLEDGLGSAWDSIVDMFSPDAMADVGTNLVAGLVNGLTGGLGTVIQAAAGLGEGAISAVKGVLGIHSPSAVMYDLGEHTTAGFNNALEDGQSATQAAMGDAVAAPAAAVPAGGGGGVTVNVEAGAVVLPAGTSSADAQKVQSMVQAGLAAMMQQVLAELGLLPAAEATS